MMGSARGSVAQKMVRGRPGGLSEKTGKERCSFCFPLF